MSIFGYPPDGVSFTLSAGDGVTITFSDNIYTVSATGSNADASYITYNDETGTFPNSSRLAAGNNVSFDNTGGVFTINAAATGGGAPTTLSYVTTNSEAALSGERVLTEAYGVSITDNTTTVDVGLSPTFLAIPFFTIGNHAGLTGERSLVVLDGLASSDLGSGSTLSISASPLQQPEYITVSSSSNLPNERVLTAGSGIDISDAGAGSTITVSNTSSAFNTIQIAGQSDVVADALQDTLTFIAGSNVTLTTSGDSITIASTDTTNPDQNLFQTISVSGQSDIVADSTTDILTFAPGDGVEITTNASTDTLTITNTASSFNQIVVSGQSDIIASQILNSFEVAEGTGITLTTSGSSLTITNSSPNIVQNVFTTFAVSGQSDVVADSSTDTITLIAGEGIDITTNASADSITLTNNSSGFSQVIVSGQGDVIASELHNSLEFVAGTNITLTTSGTSITINAAGGGDAPADAEYLVLSANGTLTDERVLTPGTGLTLVDVGAGNNAILTNSASSFGKVVVVGESDIDAHYLQDQFALEAGSNVTLTVTGSTINIASVGASGGGGGAPTDAEYVVLSTDGTLTDERVLAVGSGLDLSDGGAGSNITLANTASSFGKIEVVGQNDVVAYLLQDQFALAEGSNVTLTTSGSTITISSTDTNTQNPDQNLFSTVRVDGWGDVDVDSTTTILHFQASGNMIVATDPTTNTVVFNASALQPLDSTLTALAGYDTNGLVVQTSTNTFAGRSIAAGDGISVSNGDGVIGNPTLTNAASSFGRIKVSGQSDVVAYLLQDQFGLVEGSNVTITTSGSDITIAATDTQNPDQNLFQTISVAGQSDVVADSTTDILTLAEGSGVDITTNASTDTITFTNTASSFGTVVVDGTPISSNILQGQFGLTAGSNVTLTPSGTSIQISSTDTGEANQNAYSFVAPTGFPTLSAGSATDTLVVNGSGGITVGANNNTLTVSGTGLQPLDADLTALAALSTTGMMARTDADTYIMRTITGTASSIDVTNGDGVSGNPTISISDNPVIEGTAGMVLPSGTTAQRTSTEGILRYNTDDNVFEGYDNDSWVQFGAGGGATPTVRSLPTSGTVTSGQYYHDGNWSSTGNLTFEHGVKAFINGTFDLNSGHTLTVLASGYAGGRVAGPQYANANDGKGPGGGGGGVYSSGGGAGGSFGGSGGKGGDTGGYAGYPLPAYSWSLERAGSGGGSGANAGSAALQGRGGNGGGGVDIEAAGAITISENFNCNGENGVAGAGSNAGGGGSGGYVGLKSAVSITVGSGKSISVVGGAGASNTKGGGGGGGGWIVLWAPTITITGSLTKSGGAAGTGGSPAAGSTGQDIQITSSPIFEFNQGT